MKSQSTEFPVKIDLGREVPDYSSEMDSAPSGKKRKMKTIYPTLYIDGGADLAKLQKDGWALIKYHRNSVRLSDAEGEDKASGEIEVRTLCLPDKDGDVMDEFAKFAKSKGVDTEGVGSSDDEDSEEESEPDGEES